MADSFFGTIVSFVSDATNNFDAKEIQRFTGQEVDSVDQFMSRTQTFNKNYGKGLLAGLIGGLVATGIKMIVDREVAPDTVHTEDKIADSAVAGIEEATGRDIWNDEQEEVVATIIEFGMGALIGGAYGLLVEAIPDAQKISNERLMTTTQQLALPALGLIPAAGADLAHHKAQNLAGHAAFVGTCEVVRRAVRLGLEEG